MGTDLRTNPDPTSNTKPLYYKAFALRALRI